MKQRENLVDRVFGNLKVIEFIESKNHTKSYKVRCKCGYEFTLRERALTMENRKLCKDCKKRKVIPDAPKYHVSPFW